MSVNIEVSDISFKNRCVTRETPAGHAKCDVTNTCQQCQLVRKSKVIIKPGWGSNEREFPIANCIVLEKIFSVCPSFSMEYISFIVKGLGDKSQ